MGKIIQNFSFLVLINLYNIDVFTFFEFATHPVPRFSFTIRSHPVKYCFAFYPVRYFPIYPVVVFFAVISQGELGKLRYPDTVVPPYRASGTGAG